MNQFVLENCLITCEHKDKCELKDPLSRTCTTGGGPYCGRWRELEARQ